MISRPLRGRALIGITAAHLGPEAEAAADLGPLRELAEPVFDTFGTIPAAGLCRIHGDPGAARARLTGSLLLDEMPDEDRSAPGARGPRVRESAAPGGLSSARRCHGRDSRRSGRAGSLAGRYAVSAVGILMDASVAQAVDERLARLIDRMAPWTTRPGT